MELANPSELSFMKFAALDDVIERYGFVCREIERLSAEHLRENIRRTIAASRRQFDELAISEVPTDPKGTFRLFILNPYSFDRPSQAIAYPVQGFGPIRKVEIEYSSSIKRYVEPHVETFISSIEHFQKLFTSKYIELHEKNKKSIVADIENILLSVCATAEEKIIRDRCRISVTVPFSNNFRFYISTLQLRGFINLIAKRKFEFDVDPVLAMTSFLYCDEQDFFYHSFREGREGFLNAYFSETEMVSINLYLVKMERIINRAARVSCIELAEYAGFSLQISTAPEQDHAVDRIVSKCRKVLAQKFTDNVNNYNIKTNRIDDILRPMLINHVSRLQNFGRTTIVKIGFDKVVEVLANNALLKLIGGP